MLTIKAPGHPNAHHMAGGHPVTLRDKLATRSGTYGLTWAIWIAYLITPFFVLLGSVLFLMAQQSVVHKGMGETWFITMMIWIGAGIPMAFYIRSKLYFRSYWEGKPVSPRQYLRGMLLVWTVIELAGILSLVGCIVSGELIPNLIPALLAFVVFITQWPNASAMTEVTGNKDDPSVFQHPR